MAALEYAEQLDERPLEEAWITPEGSLVYRCRFCRRGRLHYHGAADEVIGTVTHRVSHCPIDKNGVHLLVVRDDREAAA